MITHEQKMADALRGIIANDVGCGCPDCKRNGDIAREALRPPLCDHGYTVCSVCKLEAPIVPPGTECERPHVWRKGEPVVTGVEHVIDYGAIRPI